jgi:hypothetical protein
MFRHLRARYGINPVARALYQPVRCFVALRDTYPLDVPLYHYSNLVDEYMAPQLVQSTLESDREICSGFQ